jgi:hypothetical protein
MNITGWQLRCRRIKHPLRPAHPRKLNYGLGSEVEVRVAMMPAVAVKSVAYHCAAILEPMRFAFREQIKLLAALGGH